MVWRSAFMLCAFGAFSFVPATAFADDLPAAADLLAKVKAATGARPSSYEIHVQTTSLGGVTHTTILHSGDDYREIDDTGPLHAEDGRFHKQDWHQNENGQTYLEQPIPGAQSGNSDEDDSAFDPAGVTVSRVSTPVDAYVVSRKNDDGTTEREYVEPQTYHEFRDEVLDGGKTTVQVYDDFRTVGGYTRSWHWTIRDGNADDNEEGRVESIVPRAVTDAELTIPSPRRAVVQFPADNTRVDLPAKLIGGMWVVQVTIGGRGYDFLLDTGAAGISVDEATAKRLGLNAVTRYVNTVNAGRYKSSVAVVPSMSVGDLQMRDIVVHTVPSVGSPDPNVRPVGLLGFDFIAELAIQLDYDNGHAFALAGGTNLVGGSDAITLDVRLGTETPETTLILNGERGDRFTIDTGAAAALFVNYGFAHDHPKAVVDRGGGNGVERFLSFGGIGGKVDTKPAQLALVQLGPVHFTDFVAYIDKERTQYTSGDDGVIGATLLRYFTVWLDYAHSHVILIPNAQAHKGY